LQSKTFKQLQEIDMSDISIARAKFLASPFRIGQEWQVRSVQENAGKPTGLESSMWFQAGDKIVFSQADANGNPTVLNIQGTAGPIPLDKSGTPNARNLFATTSEVVNNTKVTTNWVIVVGQILVGNELMVRVKITAASNGVMTGSPDGDVLTNPVKPT
jgi:hypothetical protein